MAAMLENSMTESISDISIAGAEITTIIPTFRRPSLLRRAIQSAVDQEEVNLRIEVLDNCSGDETGNVVADLARDYNRVHYHCHSKNIGAQANFEFGVRRVETPYFSILSDDDYLLPDFYRRALAGLAANPDAMFWVGMTLNVDERGTIWDARLDRWPREGMFYPPEGVLTMTGGLAPTWTGIVFRKELLDLLGFIDPETLGPADLDYTLRLGARFPFLVEKHPSAVFSINSDSFSATQPLSSFWPGWLKMFENMANLESLSASDRHKLLAALHADAQRMLFRRGVNALANGRTDFAKDASLALSESYSGYLRPWVLRSLSVGCEHIPGFFRVFRKLYAGLEKGIVNSRRELQKSFGHLLRLE
ncbi:glycosyltransferase family 2 protein [Dokdonella sp.]|uniref:glycosyltransferase family 2 protein n=1 Tax=Dokdonella sp. TaxID=2291710 RepID=UPI00352777E5